MDQSQWDILRELINRQYFDFAAHLSDLRFFLTHGREKGLLRPVPSEVFADMEATGFSDTGQSICWRPLADGRQGSIEIPWLNRQGAANTGDWPDMVQFDQTRPRTPLWFSATEVPPLSRPVTPVNSAVDAYLNEPERFWQKWRKDDAPTMHVPSPKPDGLLGEQRSASAKSAMQGMETAALKKLLKNVLVPEKPPQPTPEELDKAEEEQRKLWERRGRAILDPSQRGEKRD